MLAALCSTTRDSLFASTRWTVVRQAADSQTSSQHALSALSELCQIYWRPVYLFLRRKGIPQHDAQDLTQSFFADLIEDRTYARADQIKGQFRSFLLGTLKHFLAHARDRECAQKRGGGTLPVRLDEVALSEAETHAARYRNWSTDGVFEREWAASLLRQALDRLAQEYAVAGKDALFEALKVHLGTGAAAAVPYEEIARPAINKIARVCETCGSPIETTNSGDFGCMVCLYDAALAPDPEEGEVAFASVPDQFGAYTIEHHVDGSVWELGHGAMGVTYRALDKVLDRPVALKIISANVGSRSAHARERFMREARASAALRHPNVATVYQFGVREGTGQFFYAMELVEGETLEERVRRRGPLEVLTTIDIALQVTAALAAAEERRLVHRDLKPGNLMLVSAGAAKKVRMQRAVPTVKIIDFGVAKAVSEKTNEMALTHGGFVGTPAFASPEQFTNAAVDVRSDIYSLGATLWFLLTGHTLFNGQTIEEIRRAQQSNALPIAQLKAARVPRRLRSLLKSMLAIEPAARPGTHDLAVRLQRCAASANGVRPTRVALAAAAILIPGVSAFFVFHSLRYTPRLSAPA